MCDEGPKQQILPRAGGLVGGEHQQQRGEKCRHLLEEPGQRGRDHLGQSRGLHVAPVGELRLPVIDQVRKSRQDEGHAQRVEQIPVTVHLNLGSGLAAAATSKAGHLQMRSAAPLGAAGRGK